MDFVSRKYSGSKYAFKELAGIGGHKPANTPERREAISQYYAYELMRELDSPGDGMSEREVYEAFAKRHKLGEVPMSPHEAQQMLTEKFRKTAPVSIDIIYKKLVDRARKRMIGDVFEDEDWDKPGSAYQHPL